MLEQPSFHIFWLITDRYMKFIFWLWTFLVWKAGGVKKYFFMTVRAMNTTHTFVHDFPNLNEPQFIHRKNVNNWTAIHSLWNCHEWTAVHSRSLSYYTAINILYTVHCIWKDHLCTLSWTGVLATGADSVCFWVDNREELLCMIWTCELENIPKGVRVHNRITAGSRQPKKKNVSRM